jgi:hypothetical protein
MFCEQSTITQLREELSAIKQAYIRVLSYARLTLQKLKSQSHVTTDGQSTSQSWCQAPSGVQDKIFVTVRQSLFCRCGAPSLTKGRVCHLLWS